jgi:hypothetical protein
LTHHCGTRRVGLPHQSHRARTWTLRCGAPWCDDTGCGGHEVC